MSAKAGPTAPQAPHDFNYSPDSIAKVTAVAIERTRKLEDAIGSLKPQDCTFQNVVLPLALDEAAFASETDPAAFMQSVSTNKLVRDAATEATMKISDFSIEVMAHRKYSVTHLAKAFVLFKIPVIHAEGYLHSSAERPTEYSSQLTGSRVGQTAGEDAAR